MSEKCKLLEAKLKNFQKKELCHHSNEEAPPQTAGVNTKSKIDAYIHPKQNTSVETINETHFQSVSHENDQAFNGALKDSRDSYNAESNRQHRGTSGENDCILNYGYSLVGVELTFLRILI